MIKYDTWEACDECIERNKEKLEIANPYECEPASGGRASQKKNWCRQNP